jgi:UDP-glucose 4-epimerase
VTSPLPRRLAVLGGTGFVGGHVAREFAERGVETTRLGSRDFDLSQPSSVDALVKAVGPEDMLFFAAVIPPRLGRDRATMLRNVAMAETVCRLLERARCARLVYMSTDNVYAAEEETLHEGTRLDPVDLYGLGHLVRERMLAEAAASAGVPCLVLRTGPVYGPGNRNDSYGPDRFLLTAVEEGVIRLFGGGEEIRHHLFAPDLARAVRCLAEVGHTGVIHVAPAVGATFLQLAEMVRALVGAQVRIEQQPRRVPVRHRVHVPARLRSILPEFSCLPLEAGLASSLAARRMPA